MSEKIFLLALLPYALLLVWGMRKLQFTDFSIAVLCLLTVGVVWGILYASFSLVVFSLDPAPAFATVDYLMNDLPYEWILRYTAERFGWLVGLLYFGICWVVAALLPQAT